MQTKILSIIPVLPSADIARDIAWYREKTGFEVYYSDRMYAVVYREPVCLHLQWHADTENDPRPGGSVIRLYVKNIKAIFNEFIERGTVKAESFKTCTPWKTNEFGFYDLNRNAIFVMEDADSGARDQTETL